MKDFGKDSKENSTNNETTNSLSNEFHLNYDPSELDINYEATTPMLSSEQFKTKVNFSTEELSATSGKRDSNSTNTNSETPSSEEALENISVKLKKKTSLIEEESSNKKENYEKKYEKVNFIEDTCRHYNNNTHKANILNYKNKQNYYDKTYRTNTDTNYPNLKYSKFGSKNIYNNNGNYSKNFRGNYEKKDLDNFLIENFNTVDAAELTKRQSENRTLQSLLPDISQDLIEDIYSQVSKIYLLYIFLVISKNKKPTMPHLRKLLSPKNFYVSQFSVQKKLSRRSCKRLKQH